MSETATRDGSSTVADYEAFVATRCSDDGFELIRGRIVMMTNPSEDHGQIAGNLFAPLKTAMDAAGCRVYAGGVRVQRSEDRDGDMAVIPDIVVRCGPRRDRNFLTDPLVVVEILSPSTMHIDRGAKFEFYRSLPSLRHIVFVYQRQVRVEHFRRAAEGWTPFELVRMTDRLDLDAIDFWIELDRIYFDVPALRAVDVLSEDGSSSPIP